MDLLGSFCIVTLFLLAAILGTAVKKHDGTINPESQKTVGVSS